MEAKMEAETEAVRCFVALEMPREVINYLKEVQGTLKKRNIFLGKFTEPENLHLTLKFLGEISEKKVEEVKKSLEKIKFSEFEASLGRFGVFTESFVRILWIKLNGKPIWGLQKKIDEKLEESGFAKEERFMGHLTIARIKNVSDKKDFLEYIKQMKCKEMKFRVSEFVLKKSELKPEGPVYTDLERYKLK